MYSNNLQVKVTFIPKVSQIFVNSVIKVTRYTGTIPFKLLVF